MKQLGAVPLTSDVLAKAQIGLWAFELDEGDDPRMYADETMCRLLGVTGNESPNEIYHAWYDNIDPHHFDEVAAAVEKMISGVHAEVQYPWHHPTEGTTIVRCGGVRNPAYEKGIRIEGCHQNVTDVVHYQRKTEEQQKVCILNAIVSDFSSVYSVNLKTRVCTTLMIGERNAENVKKLLSRALCLADVLDIYVQEWVHPADRSRLRNLLDFNALKKELSHRQRLSVQFRSLTGQESYRYLELIVAKTEAMDAEAENVLLIFCDVDDRVREEVRRQKDLENALQAAQAASEAKSNFLFNLSHDIRTPMNALIGFTDMAKKNIDDRGKLSECLGKVSYASEQLLGIINDLLDMSRIENYQVELDLQPVLPQTAMTELVGFITPIAQKYGVKLVVEREDELSDNTPLWVDKVRAIRILMNILTNAIKYSHRGGTVHFLSKSVPSKQSGFQHWTFVVTDEGIGMSEGFQKHIFEAFSRERNSTLSQIQGTGLGLAITKGLVDLMDGKIQVESAPGKGTKVTLDFEFRIAQDGMKSVDENPLACMASLKGKHVLLVEDNELNREIAKELLEESGLIVGEAADGTEAIEAVQDMLAKKGTKSIDFILMDIQMPVMNGYKATSEILNLPGFKELNIPIIALSANASVDDRQRSLSYGMKAHVAKPIKSRELFETLLSCMN